MTAEAPVLERTGGDVFEEPYTLLSRRGRVMSTAHGLLSEGVTFEIHRHGTATCVHLHDEHVMDVSPAVTLEPGDELVLTLEPDIGGAR